MIECGVSTCKFARYIYMYMYRECVKKQPGELPVSKLKRAGGEILKLAIMHDGSSAEAEFWSLPHELPRRDRRRTEKLAERRVPRDGELGG